ncbi:gas vesicle protein [Streptomyces hygroscopicus subsp. hygroscopicus]|uniref:gas vesicle protein n=1 Tax=Streptomyces hygroscopicus TaxID=1912 RepID=UPI0007675147|nr:MULTISPECIES: gas vesicle protein [Streptomyces]MBW8086778.1 gas vesicle protein [Streptomyces hygroscopicus subsp. hygroscopicus]
MTRAVERREVALVDLLDRVLAGGVVIAGEITLTIADIDLVRISLRALIASVRVEGEGRDEAEGEHRDG